jgi:hypothetical protein
MDEEKNLGGRPKFFTEEKVKLLRDLLKIQCTASEAASVLGCSEKTIERYAAEVAPGEGFVGLLKKYGGEGLISLRRAQWQQALKKGNTTMLIWLGKQHLGQSDKTQMELPRATIQVKYNLDDD